MSARRLRAAAPALAAAAVAALAVAALAGAASAGAQRITLFARPPAPAPVSLTVAAPDGTVYGGTYFPLAGNHGDAIRSRLFAWDRHGRRVHAWTIAGQDLAADHGIQATALDAAGAVYLLDNAPPRVIRFDPRTGRQTTYATIPRLPQCTAPGQAACKRSSMDNAPAPDYAAWGPDGSLYVTDTAQAAIFRVPPGGGRARLWLTDPRFDAGAFGLTGLALAPDHRSLYATTVGSSATVAPDPSVGSLMRIAILPDGSAGAVRTLWRSAPLEAPDGFAVARSGHLYVALLGPGANRVVELSPSGRPIGAIPAPGVASPVPFDTPSSVTFAGRRLLITDISYFDNNPAHRVILAVDTTDEAASSIVPRPGRGPHHQRRSSAPTHR